MGVRRSIAGFAIEGLPKFHAHELEACWNRFHVKIIVEGDLLSGPNNTYIATLVERQTRYVMLVKVAGKDTRTVVTALIKQAKKLPRSCISP